MAGDGEVILDWLEEAGLERLPRALEAARALLRKHGFQAAEMLENIQIAGPWTEDGRFDAIFTESTNGEDEVIGACNYYEDGHWTLWVHPMPLTDSVDRFDNSAEAMAAVDTILQERGWALAANQCAGPCGRLGFPPWCNRPDYPELIVYPAEPGIYPDVEANRNAYAHRLVCWDCQAAVHDQDIDRAEKLRQVGELERAARESRAGTPITRATYRNASDDIIPMGRLVSMTRDGQGIVAFASGQNMVGVAERDIAPGEYGSVRTSGFGAMERREAEGSDPTRAVLQERENLRIALRANGLLGSATIGLLCEQVGGSRRYLSATEAELMRRFFRDRPIDRWSLPDTVWATIDGIEQDLREAAMNRGDVNIPTSRIFNSERSLVEVDLPRDAVPASVREKLAPGVTIQLEPRDYEKIRGNVMNLPIQDMRNINQNYSGMPEGRVTLRASLSLADGLPMFYTVDLVEEVGPTQELRNQEAIEPAASGSPSR